MSSTQKLNRKTGKTNETICWIGDVDGHVSLIDQTKLPDELTRIDCQDVESVWEAIKTLRVRSAQRLGLQRLTESLSECKRWVTRIQRFFLDDLPK